jgi:hypothetical protein
MVGEGMANTVILQELLPKDEGGSGSCDAQGVWPAYSGAKFIFKDESDKEIQCKLQYEATKGEIQLFPENADSLSNDQTFPVPLPLLEIDPSDVIGIRIAISFDPDETVDPTRDPVEDEIEDTPMTRTKPRNASALATLNIFSYPRVSRFSSYSFLYRWFGYGEESGGNKPIKRR